uniref:DevR family CRISPR-associated autoregulator n=1 Tax=candidate division WOR-3 bacterium TaxID=2052148 RepID=A0A7C3NEN5_UNCW3
MLKFVTFAVKTQLNVHDLNNEAVAGNVTDIRIMEFLDENGNRIEAPAVSGRMLKHWHYEGMRHLINGAYWPIPLCAACKVGEPVRPGTINDKKLSQMVQPEKNLISECAVCDIHGYLIAQVPKGENKEKGTSTRRTSRVMFSWLMPVLGYDTTQKQVIHTRVSQQGSVDEGEESAQMIFNKSYASGIYAFVSALDVDRIGLEELNLGNSDRYAIKDDERKNRIKVAVEAYRLILSGQIGASLSHSIPHQNPIELLVIYSKEGPLPFPVSPIYSDYFEKTIGLIPKNNKNIKILYWGQKESLDKNIVIKKNTVDEIFEELKGEI